MTDENPDATPNLTDSVRLSSTESTDKKFFAARLRQLDDSKLNPAESKHNPMIWHRSFRGQCWECKEAVNRFIVKTPEFHAYHIIIPAQEIIVCVPFQTHCHSAACRHKRENIKPNFTPPRYDDVFFEGLAQLDEAAK